MARPRWTPTAEIDRELTELAKAAATAREMHSQARAAAQARAATVARLHAIGVPYTVLGRTMGVTRTRAEQVARGHRGRAAG
jgi:hypothetical protein